MLESMRRGQRWLTGIFVAVIGLVFAAFIGLGGPLTRGGSATAVVQLDGEAFGVSEFERIRSQQEQRFRETLGDQFDARSARQFLDSQALRTLIDSAVMAHAARELGYRVSKEEIQRAVREIPGFRDESGRFDKETFLEQVEYAYGSQQIFLRTLRDDLLRRKLGRLLYDQVAVSEGEARAAARYALEQIRIAIVVLDPEAPGRNVELSDEEVESYAAEHDAELREQYELRGSDFAEPERRRVRHILFRKQALASEAEMQALRARADAALKRIAEGASFEDVAMELSEDPGSKEAGGDLGFIARGEVADELESAAFSMQPGDAGRVVESEQGFHVVRIEEIQPARQRSFEEVRGELARDEAEAAAAEREIDALAERLAAAIRDGQSLEESARAEELTLERTGEISRRPDGFVPGLGASPELLATAFALDEGASSPRIFRVGAKRALVQVLERPPIDPDKLAQAIDEQRERLRETERSRLIQEWVDAEREALQESGRLVVNAELVLSQ